MQQETTYSVWRDEIRRISIDMILEEWKAEIHLQSDSVVTRSQDLCARTQPEHLPEDDRSTTQARFANLQREQGIGIETREEEKSILEARESDLTLGETLGMVKPEGSDQRAPLPGTQRLLIDPRSGTATLRY
jgi:hypothetical protein